MKVYTIVFLVFFASCKVENDIELNLFKIEQGVLTVDDLKNQGFVKSEVDAIMFEKSINDTIITYEFTEDLSKSYSKSWSFIIPNQTIEVLEKGFEKYDVYLMVPESFENLSLRKTFCLKQHTSNLVYFSTIDSLENRRIVDIVYYFPL